MMTITQATIRAWVVDVGSSAVLMDGMAPACLSLSADVLGRLNDFDYARVLPTTLDIVSQTMGAHADVVIDLQALSALHLLKVGAEAKSDAKHLSTHYRFNGGQLSCMSYRHLMSSLDERIAMQLSHALQLLRWRQDHRYCSRCATPTTPHALEYGAVCSACQHRSYPRVQPCVITAIMRSHPTSGKKQLLLAQHHRHKDGMYGLVAGFVEIGESLESAVLRETQEETGLTVSNIRYINSQPWPYPSNLMVGFVADYAGGEICVQVAELADAQFFDLDHLPKIPPLGTIARCLIDKVCSGDLPTTAADIGFGVQP